MYIYNATANKNIENRHKWKWSKYKIHKKKND
jgi:hypothetical protein